MGFNFISSSLPCFLLPRCIFILIFATSQCIRQRVGRVSPVGKRTAQKDTIKDITSDSQVNSCSPYRWSPASLTFNIYFNLFLYLYITRITMNNDTSHLKSPKNQNRRAALAWPAIKLTGGGGGGGRGGGLELVCGRLTLVLSSALVHLTK